MATRSVRVGDATYTLAHRNSTGAGTSDDPGLGLPAPTMALVTIHGPAGFVVTQALRVGELEAMTDAQLAALVEDVLEARRREG